MKYINYNLFLIFKINSMKRSKLLNSWGWKRGHKLREACMVVLTNSATKSNHIGWSERKSSYWKQFIAGSLILGLQFPWQSSIFAVSEPIFLGFVGVFCI